MSVHPMEPYRSADTPTPHLLEQVPNGCGVRDYNLPTVQSLLGYENVSTNLIHTRVLNYGGRTVKGSLESKLPPPARHGVHSWD
jgi:hypothetical protein